MFAQRCHKAASAAAWFAALLLSGAASGQVIVGVYGVGVDVQTYNISTGSYGAPIDLGQLTVRAMAADDVQRILYFSSGSRLWKTSYDQPRTSELIGSFSGGTAFVVGGLAWDSRRGKLYATSGLTDQLLSQYLFEVDLQTASCTLIRAFGAGDFGGMDYDTATDLMYLVNDVNTSANGLSGRGLYSLAFPYATSPMVRIAPYPNRVTGAGELDIDGVAAGNGRVYLCTDETNSMYIYNLATGAYETPIAQTPFGTDKTACGATFAASFFTGGAFDAAAQLTGPPDCSVIVGGNAVFRGSVRNAGGRTVTGVRAALILPQGAMLLGSTPPGVLNAGVLTVHLGTLAPGASATVDVTVRPGLAGFNAASLTAAISEADADPGNNTAAASVRIAPTPPAVALITGVVSTVAASASSAISDLPGVRFVGSFGRPFHSADGSRWIIKGFVNAPAATDEVLLVGDQAGVRAAAREGLYPQIPGVQGPLPPVAFDQIFAINNAGAWAFSGSDGRSGTGGGGGEGGSFVGFGLGFGAGAGVGVIAREGQSVPNLADVFYNQPRGGVAMSDFGDIGFLTSLSGAGVTPANNTALFSHNGQQVRARADVSVPTGQSNGAGSSTFFPIKSFDWNLAASGLSMDFSGDQFSICGAINGSTTNPPPGGVDRVAMRSDPERGGAVIWVQENCQTVANGPGQTAADTSPVAFSFMEPSGAWLVIGALGPLNGGVKWVMRNNIVLGRSGEPIAPNGGGGERWSTARSPACFAAICDDGMGHYAIIGATDASDVLRDAVAVIDGTTILARENDPVDLNGNGAFDDGAYIASFVPHGAFLTSQVLYAVVTLRSADAAGACAPDDVIGEALVRIPLPAIAPPCAADFNQDGGVDGADIESFFASWSIGDAAADVNQDGGIDGSDVEAFFVVWQAGGC